MIYNTAQANKEVEFFFARVLGFGTSCPWSYCSGGQYGGSEWSSALGYSRAQFQLESNTP